MQYSTLFCKRGGAKIHSIIKPCVNIASTAKNIRYFSTRGRHTHFLISLLCFSFRRQSWLSSCFYNTNENRIFSRGKNGHMREFAKCINSSVSRGGIIKSTLCCFYCDAIANAAAFSQLLLHSKLP